MVYVKQRKSYLLALDVKVFGIVDESVRRKRGKITKYAVNLFERLENYIPTAGSDFITVLFRYYKNFNSEINTTKIRKHLLDPYLRQML